MTLHQKTPTLRIRGKSQSSWAQTRVASVDSEPAAEKEPEPNISLVHSVVPMKWAKDHIKTKLVYKRKDNCQLIKFHRRPVSKPSVTRYVDNLFI